MDFITDLPISVDPVTKTRHNAILVIVDRLTKWAYFFPCNKKIGAEGCAHLFLRYVFAHHGMPKELITDRDPRFRAKFWQTLVHKLGTKHKMSTTAHPQTDGQTERTNQTLEQYLRFYLNYRQNNWVELLPLAQYAYNSTSTEATQTTPFYANYGFDPTAFGEPQICEVLAQKAMLRADQLRELHQELARDIKFTAYRMAMYYDRRRQASPPLKEGDKVWLLRKNIKTTRSNDKLDHKKIGPYQIKKKLSPVSFKLKLPERVGIHPVFHVSLLEPAHSNAEPDPEIEIHPDDADREWPVEKILNGDWINGQYKYLIKWEGTDPAGNPWEPSWEPVSHLNCEGLIQEYHRQNPDRPNPEHPPMTQSREEASRTPKTGQPALLEEPARRNPPRHHRLNQITRTPEPPAPPQPQWPPTPVQTTPDSGNPGRKVSATGESPSTEKWRYDESTVRPPLATAESRPHLFRSRAGSAQSEPAPGPVVDPHDETQREKSYQKERNKDGPVSHTRSTS